MEISKYLAAPIKLITLFVLLSVLPLAALGWLGWSMLEQGRAMENQQLRERLESAGILLSHELNRGLAAWKTVLLRTLPAPRSPPTGRCSACV
jgi:threonine/homoserine/homoserine lactone efflux protein